MPFSCDVCLLLWLVSLFETTGGRPEVLGVVVRQGACRRKRGVTWSDFMRWIAPNGITK